MKNKRINLFNINGLERNVESYFTIYDNLIDFIVKSTKEQVFDLKTDSDDVKPFLVYIEGSSFELKEEPFDIFEDIEQLLTFAYNHIRDLEIYLMLNKSNNYQLILEGINNYDNTRIVAEAKMFTFNRNYLFIDSFFNEIQYYNCENKKECIEVLSSDIGFNLGNLIMDNLQNYLIMIYNGN